MTNIPSLFQISMPRCYLCLHQKHPSVINKSVMKARQNLKFSHTDSGMSVQSPTMTVKPFVGINTASDAILKERIKRAAQRLSFLEYWSILLHTSTEFGILRHTSACLRISPPLRKSPWEQTFLFFAQKKLHVCVSPLLTSVACRQTLKARHIKERQSLSVWTSLSSTSPLKHPF